MTAVTVYSLAGFSGLGGRLALGAMADRIGAKPVLVGGLFVQALCVAAYLYFFYLPKAEVPAEMAHSVWTPYFVGYAFVAGAFILRAAITCWRSETRYLKPAYSNSLTSDPNYCR